MKAWFFLLCFAAMAADAQPLLFTTWAGYAGHGASDGLSTNAQFNRPQGIAFDTSSNLYVSDSGNNTIREITPAGIVTTIAGQAGLGGSADGTNALFNHPAGLAVSSSGNIYVADFGNDTIRVIAPGGGVSTLAGSAGIPGTANANGTNALFNEPQGVAVDAAGNVYVADYGNDTIRVIATGGGVSTLAGSPGNPGSADGPIASATFYQPGALALDSATNLYVADTANNTIRMITPAGMVTTLAGGSGNFGLVNATGTNAMFYAPCAIAVDAATNVYVADSFNNAIRMIAPGGVVTTLALQFSQPAGVAAGNGSIYVADTGNGTIRAITNGVLTMIAGSPSVGSIDGPGAIARFDASQSVAVDGNGNSYIADSANSTIREVSPVGVVTTIAGSPGVLGAVNGTATNALFSDPLGIATDGKGNIYIADTGNSVVRQMNSGAVTTLAGIAYTPGNLDGPATSAQFNQPAGVAVDRNGNVYIADTGNNTIRKITSGVVSTVAGSIWSFGSADGVGTNALFHQPEGIAVDSSGNIYVADTLNQAIREIAPGGIVITIAGIAGVSGSTDGQTNALFSGPVGVAVDGSGNVYVTDSGNETVRKLVPGAGGWMVSTVAGTPLVSGSSDGLGSAALFNYPAGIATSGGYFYIVDGGNNTVRIDQTIGPSILVQPLSQTNQAGTPVTLTVTASGTAPLTYLWEYNGSAVGTDTNSVSAGQSGSYTVMVSNAGGMANSQATMVVFTNGIPGSFQSISILPGGTVQLNMTGGANVGYAVQASSDLFNWVTLSTISSTNASLEYLDTSATNYPARFYRLSP
jgi:uncharacterized repeat protein (TIGR01451 family)